MFQCQLKEIGGWRALHENFKFKIVFQYWPTNAFSASKPLSTSRGYLFTSVFLNYFFPSFFFSVFKNYSLGLICQTFLFASYVTEMIKWISCPPLACWGIYHKCFLSKLPNFQQCVKCILVTTKDAYGHWDICQIEYKAKKVPYFALEQVRTYWEEGKK